MAPNNAIDKSPFFAPSTPRKLIQVSTPGGTSRLIKKDPPPTAQEHKSTIAGATSNLVNAIIGAGIVGIPFAIKETGLIAGILLIILCAILTEKSLRVLIDTAKHVDVPSYETLFESTYGSFGFYFISVNMLIMAYGGCLSYLTIIKDTLPILLGVQQGDVGMERSILIVSTMAIILPISMQRVSRVHKMCIARYCLDLLCMNHSFTSFLFFNKQKYLFNAKYKHPTNKSNTQQQNTQHRIWQTWQKHPKYQYSFNVQWY